MELRKALKAAAAGTIAPVYVCYGSEVYLMNEFIVALTDKVVEPDQREFAVSKFDLHETPVEAVIEDAETFPFMAERKVVIAKNAAMFTGAKDTGKVVHDMERLAAYLKAPVDYAVLIFTAYVDKLDERKKIVKTLKDADALIPCLPLTGDDLTKWVHDQAGRRSFTFEPGAAEQLVLYTGGQLQAMQSELEKLSLFVGAQGRVAPALVDELVVRSAEQNVFQLIEDIVQMRLDKALAALDELLKQREEPIKIVALLARQFRILLQVKELAQQGYSHQQIASQISLHPYAVKLADGQTRKYDTAKLSRILSQLADLDYKMKSGGIDKVLGLELFLLGLAA